MSLSRDTRGLLFTESISKPVGSMINSWPSKARGKNNNRPGSKNHGRGASSLQAMAMRACAWNADLILPETLQWAGWQYAGRIYRHLKATDSLTFNAWNIFLEAFPGEINQHQQFRVPLVKRSSNSDHAVQLVSIFGRLSKLEVNCLTLLCIRQVQFNYRHLMHLLPISTLAGLIVDQTKEQATGVPNITSRNLRDWRRAACEKRAFAKLTFLHFCGVMLDTASTVEEVSQFPALTLLGVSHPLHDEHGTAHTAHGWEYIDPSWLDENFPLPDCTGRKASCCSSVEMDSARMKTLHQWSRQLSQELGSTIRNVSVLFGNRDETRSPLFNCRWLTRTAADRVAKQETQRALPIATKNDSANSNKRRKVRGGKKMDVGTLLGSFT